MISKLKETALIIRRAFFVSRKLHTDMAPTLERPALMDIMQEAKPKALSVQSKPLNHQDETVRTRCARLKVSTAFPSQGGHAHKDSEPHEIEPAVAFATTPYK